MSAIQQVLASVGGVNIDPAPTIFQSSSNSSGLGYPVTPIAGDLAVLVSYVASSSGLPTDLLATGYTSIQSNQLSGTYGVRMRCMFRQMVGGESAVANLMTGNVSIDHELLLLRFQKPVSAVTAGSSSGSIVDGDPAAQTINTASATGQVIVSVGACFGALGSVSFSSFSPSGTSFSTLGGAGRGEIQLRSELLAQAASTTLDATTLAHGAGLQSFFLNVNF